MTRRRTTEQLSADIIIDGVFKHHRDVKRGGSRAIVRERTHRLIDDGIPRVCDIVTLSSSCEQLALNRRRAGVALVLE